MALGAQRPTVVWMVLREVLTLAGIGLAISLPATLAASKLVESFLYGMKAERSAHDRGCRGDDRCRDALPAMCRPETLRGSIHSSRSGTSELCQLSTLPAGDGAAEGRSLNTTECHDCVDRSAQSGWRGRPQAERHTSLGSSPSLPDATSEYYLLPMTTMLLVPMLAALAFAQQQVAGGQPVILAFGDSLTSGYGVPRGLGYPEQLQKKLDAGGYSYRV